MVTFRPRDHWRTTPFRNGKIPKAYDVLVDGQAVGLVEQVETHSYRKAGRLITRSWYPIRWRARLLSQGAWEGLNVKFEDRTREAAAKRVLEATKAI